MSKRVCDHVVVIFPTGDQDLTLGGVPFKSAIPKTSTKYQHLEQIEYSDICVQVRVKVVPQVYHYPTQ